MKKPGKLRAKSKTNSGNQEKWIGVYKTRLDKYDWICERVLKDGVYCAISSIFGEKILAEEVHHAYPRLRGPQYIFNEIYLLPLTFCHHSKVEKEEEKLDWEQQEVIINGVCYKLDLEEFRKIWKKFRLEYEEKYEGSDVVEEDKAF